MREALIAAGYLTLIILVLLGMYACGQTI